MAKCLTHQYTGPNEGQKGPINQLRPVYKSDIITVNETCLNTDTDISIPGYNVFRKELPNQVIGAGIATLVST